MKRTDVVYALFIFILIFSPLAFGTVEPWSLMIMETLCILALLLFLLEKIRFGETTFYDIPGIIPLVCLLVFIMIQFIPLPPGFVRIISPETYSIYQITAAADGSMPWITLSVSKKDTILEFFRLSSYVAFFMLTVQLLAKKELLKKTITIIVIFAALLSLFAILQHILWNNRIFWLRDLTQGGTPFGPYVNRNHYAGLMGMLFPLVMGLFLFYKPAAPLRRSRTQIAELFNRKDTNIYIILGFSAVLTATSVFLTLSRSGIVSLCLSMTAFGLIFLSRGGNRKRGIIIVVICVLVVLSVGWFGWDPIFERFERVRDARGDISDLRFQIWQDSSNIFRDFPLTGSGFGSFADIYPKYRTISGNGFAEHAHSDYVELISTGGAAGFLLGALFIFTVIFKSYRIFMKRREQYSINLYIAGISGMTALLLHSFTDFNLQTGANGLYFFFLAGLAVSAANTRLRKGLNDTYLEERKVPINKLTAMIFVLLFLCLIVNAGNLAGKIYFSSVENIRLSEAGSKDDILQARKRAYIAASLDPLNGRYQYAVANIDKMLSNDADALEHYKKAVKLRPLNGEYLQRLGLIMSEAGNYDMAENLLRSGINNDISNPSRYKRYALWLFSCDRKKDGMEYIKRAVSLEPAKTKDYIAVMVLNGLSDEEILHSLPEISAPRLLFADYLYRTGNDHMAEKEYLEAIRYLKKEEQKNVRVFYETFAFYNKKGRYSEALDIMKEAKEIFPENSRISVITAEIYEKLNMPERAVEHYREALSIDPGNAHAIRRLDSLLSGKK